MAPTGLEAAARPVVSVADVTKAFGTGSQQVVALEGVTLDVEQRRVRVPARRVGLRQEHAAQSRRRPRPARPRARVDVHAERTGLMFQEAALFPWLTVRGNVEIALKLAGVPRAERTAARRGAARDGAPRRLRQAAPARALGRHAPARRARPRARAGRRRAAHGRAVRRARRDDPRPAPRRARSAVDLDRQDDHLRDAQRARGRAPRRLRRAAREPARPRRRGLQRRRSRGPGASTRPRWRRSPRRSPTNCARRCARGRRD